MATWRIFSAAGPVSRQFSVKAEAQAEADNAEGCFGVELAVIQVCPACDSTVEKLDSEGYKQDAWACRSCGRTGH